MFATQPRTQASSGLKIRTESLPARCEICHQPDCFDPATNSCVRCQDYVHGLPPVTET